MTVLHHAIVRTLLALTIVVAAIAVSGPASASALQAQLLLPSPSGTPDNDFSPDEETNSFFHFPGSRDIFEDEKDDDKDREDNAENSVGFPASFPFTAANGRMPSLLPGHSGREAQRVPVYLATARLRL